MITVEAIAEICHEANRLYCRAIGDFSQPVWAEAPAWQKESAIDGVQKTIDYAKEHNSPLDPAFRHEGWMELKLAEGWKYGPVKDVDKKEHHCMVPYNELPEDQKLKDSLFGSIVAALAVAVEKSE